MRILFCGLVFLPLSALAEVLTVDFVKVLNGNHEEAVYYYENTEGGHAGAANAKQRAYSSALAWTYFLSELGK